jgi:hypothetical protein
LTAKRADQFNGRYSDVLKSHFCRERFFAAPIRSLVPVAELNKNMSILRAEVSMSTNPKADPAPGSNRDKEPEDWITGDETMTGAQASYLKTLCEEAGEQFHEVLTKWKPLAVSRSYSKDGTWPRSLIGPRTGVL